MSLEVALRMQGVDGGISFISQLEHCVKSPRTKWLCYLQPLHTTICPLCPGRASFSGARTALWGHWSKAPNDTNPREGRISLGELCSQPDPSLQ